jgi:transcriptional regulator with XRE-family HTH domain
MIEAITPEEREARVGQDIRDLRLFRNIPRTALCKKAGISLHALKNMENGDGTTLHSMILVLRALDREDWFNSLAPQISINPLTMVAKKNGVRQRAKLSKKDLLK